MAQKRQVPYCVIYALLVILVPSIASAYDCEVDISFGRDPVGGFEVARISCDPVDCPTDQGYECVYWYERFEINGVPASNWRCDCVESNSCGNCHNLEELDYPRGEPDPSDIASLGTPDAPDLYMGTAGQSYMTVYDKYRQVIYRDHLERGLIRHKDRSILEDYFKGLGR